MTDTIDGVTYELVEEKIDGILQLSCEKCAAIGNIYLCNELGLTCIGKGVWRVKE